MLATMTISVLWLPLLTLVSVIFGFLFRSAQIKKANKRILSLENEMLSNHAEILKLQEDLVAIEKLTGLPYKSRVVTMKDPQQDISTDNPGSSSLKKINK